MRRALILIVTVYVAVLAAFHARAAAEKVVDPKPVQVISWLDGRWVKAYGGTSWKSTGATSAGRSWGCAGR